MIRKLLILLLIVMAPVPVFAAGVAGDVDPAVLNVTVDRGVPVNLNYPASSVFIANPEVADVQVLSPVSIMVFGKRTGQTTLMATDEKGNTLLHRTVLVSQDLTDLRNALNAVIPGSKIKVEAMPDGIALIGEVGDPSIAEDARRIASRYIPKEKGDIINRIKVSGSNQIQIRVRFAEVSRDVDKRFGINWNAIGNIGGIAMGIASGSAVSGAGTLAVTRPSLDGLTNNAISGRYTNGSLDVNGLIDALVDEGFVTLLAEPTLTSMSGETASFLAGGEFPVPVPQSGDTITILFKQYGVSLAFTPTIVGENRISLHVKPEVSQLTNTGSVTINSITIPALSTRRAETTIELGSGQSFAMAGLLNNNQQQMVDKYPFLGDMPVLGALFRSTRFQNNQSELVIIITPYLVKPASSESQMALPTDGFGQPTDMERIVGFRNSNSDPEARTLSGAPMATNASPALQSQDPAVPQAAPLTPVQPVTQTGVKEDIASSKAMPVAPVSVEPTKVASVPAPILIQKTTAVKESPDREGLAGPGGFILE